MNTPLPVSSEVRSHDANVATNMIEHDLPCAGCGYNLRTQLADGRCPECAAPVAHSLNPFVLDGTDPAWCRRTGRGLHLLSWVFIAQIVIMPGLTRPEWFALIFGVQFYFEAWLATTLLKLALDVVLIVAIIRITHPDPQAPRSTRVPRATARIAALVFLGFGACVTASFTSLLLISGFDNPFGSSPDAANRAKLFWSLGNFGTALSKLIAQLAVLALLWRWLGRGHRPRYRSLAAGLYWLLLGLTIADYTIHIANATVSWFGARTTAWSLITGWIRLVFQGFHILVLVGMFITARAAAATMLRISVRD